MANTTTLKARIINLLAANGAMTKREILTALGVKTTSYGSYFAPRKNLDYAYYTQADHDRIAKKSLVATGLISQAGKNARGEVLYIAG
jgi:hypothetical protein